MYPSVTPEALMAHITDKCRQGEELNFLFFYGEIAKTTVDKACLSQWYDCTFLVDDLYYRSAEQFLMAQKARLFHDEECFDAIMRARTPKECQALGRKVKHFEQDVWDKQKWILALRGNYAKFSQNEALQRFLFSTGDKILAEANPKDTVWGIGMSAGDLKAANLLMWKGQNMLGLALMMVRSRLQVETTAPEELLNHLAILRLNLRYGSEHDEGYGPGIRTIREGPARVKSWNVQKVPKTGISTIEVCFDLTLDEMRRLQWGHIPNFDLGLDNWFMCCDIKSIRFYLAPLEPAMCAFVAHFAKHGEVYRVDSLTMNHELDQYGIYSDRLGECLFRYLLYAALGHKSEEPWETFCYEWLLFNLYDSQ